MLKLFFPAFLICASLYGYGKGGIDAPAPGQSEIKPRELARSVHEEVNRVREREGLSRLAWDGDLAEVGRAHSRDMARHDYFSHTARDGSSPSDRAQKARYECRVPGLDRPVGIGENLYMGHTYRSYRVTIRGKKRSVDYDWKTTPQMAGEVVQGWMDSPGHRRNLLSADYRREGLGVVVTRDDEVYVTQNFC